MVAGQSHRKYYLHFFHECDTMLHRASREGSVELVQCLVNKRTALDKKDSYGKTPLMVAAINWNREIAELLINSGADVNCCDNEGETVLHHVSQGGWVGMVQYLVNKGAAVNMKNFHGKTPLMVAAKRLNREVAELLINSGADVNCCDNEGQTVLHYASLGESPEMVAYDSGEDVERLMISGIAFDLYEHEWEALNPASHEGVMPNVEKIKLFIKKGAFVRFADYKILLENPSLKKAILQDVTLCSTAVINKFNYKDLPLLYEGFALANKLPHIDKIKIKEGSGMALEVEQAVTHEILTKGFCNLVKIVPSVLSILCVKSFIEKSNRAFSSVSQNSLKRLGYNPQKYPCKKICLKES